MAEDEDFAEPKLSALAKRRLKKLVEYMEALPKCAEEHFEWNSWFEQDLREGLTNPWFKRYASKIGPCDEPTEVLPQLVVEGTVTEKDLMQGCGTTACALGWAAVIPSFKRAGLSLSGDSHEVYWNGRRISHDWGDIAEFFDIDADDALRLFGGGHISTQKGWAKFARRHIERKYGVTL